MILVASLWHTGTWFTFDLLPVPYTHKRQIHLDQCVDMSGCKTIVPLRHPDAVATSWASRGLDVSMLERQWERMTQLQGVFFFPVDGKDREKRLADLSAWLELPLETNWQPMNKLNKPKVAATIKADPAFIARFW